MGFVQREMTEIWELEQQELEECQEEIKKIPDLESCIEDLKYEINKKRQELQELKENTKEKMPVQFILMPGIKTCRNFCRPDQD